MAKMSAMDIIKKAAKGPEPKSKSKTPSITMNGHEADIEDWMKANADKKDAEARQAAAEAKFLDVAEKARIGECRRDGTFHSSVKINDKILYSTANRYTAIPNESQEKLDEVFGDKSENYFKPKTEITLTDAALNDEKILEKLVAAVGAENFGTYFDVEQHISPTEQFHEARSIDAEVAAKADKLIEAGVLKQAKASCKLA